MLSDLWPVFPLMWCTDYQNTAFIADFAYTDMIYYHHVHILNRYERYERNQNVDHTFRVFVHLNLLSIGVKITGVYHWTVDRSTESVLTNCMSQMTELTAQGCPYALTHVFSLSLADKTCSQIHTHPTTVTFTGKKKEHNKQQFMISLLKPI